MSDQNFSTRKLHLSWFQWEITQSKILWVTLTHSQLCSHLQLLSASCVRILYLLKLMSKPHGLQRGQGRHRPAQNTTCRLHGETVSHPWSACSWQGHQALLASLCIERQEEIKCPTKEDAWWAGTHQLDSHSLQAGVCRWAGVYVFGLVCC